MIAAAGGAARIDDDGRARLDAALIAAHAARDLPRLVALYTAAADGCEAAEAHEASAFYLTHAYVFALEAGLPAARDLHRRLKERGREE